MSRGPRVPKAKQDQIVEWYLAGADAREIAGVFKVGLSYASSITARRGLLSQRVQPLKSGETNSRLQALRRGMVGAEPPAEVALMRPPPSDRPKLISERNIEGVGLMAEIRRLHHERRLGRTAIAAMLRVPYAEVDKALAIS
jgi:hypothetical protein